MKRNKIHDDALGIAGAETIIGTGVMVKGTIKSQTDITIDGNIEGEVSTEGDLIIGMNANITADLHGANVTVAGTLHGNITATGQATIRETGQVTGDIIAANLSIVSGGIFSGRSTMQNPGPLEPTPPSNHQTEPDNQAHT